MPVFQPLPDLSWLWRAMRQHGWIGLNSKRQRRRVAYGDELLTRAAHRGVQFSKIKKRRR